MKKIQHMKCTQSSTCKKHWTREDIQPIKIHLTPENIQTIKSMKVFTMWKSFNRHKIIQVF